MAINPILMVGVVAWAACGTVAFADDAPNPPKWVPQWHETFKGTELEGDPVDRMGGNLAADRVTGDVYLHANEVGIYRSTDAGKTFSRVDGGKLGGGQAFSCLHGLQVSPEGKKVAGFVILGEVPGARAVPAAGGSGYSLDGGATWQAFTHARWPDPNVNDPGLIERGWPPHTAYARDFVIAAIDWDSLAIVATCHDPDSAALLSTDAGKSWTKLDRRADGTQGLGITGPQTLFIGSASKIERSTGGGKTWTQVADFGALGVMRKFKNKLWWLSPAKKGVVVSSDDGKTWSLLGSPVPAGEVANGPIFGRNEEHIVVVTKTEFLESTDGCKTWKPVIEIPKGYNGGSGAFDVIHDTFYVAGSQRPLLKYQRTGKVDPEAPNGECHSPEDPRVAVVQNVESMPQPGWFIPHSMALHGDYLYVSSMFASAYFRRDADSGKLTYVDGVFNGRSKRGKLIAGGYVIRFAGGRMYQVSDDGKGISWCDIEEKTGKPVEKGKVDCPPAWQMVVSPDEKQLYVRTCGAGDEKLLWFTLDADGKPVKAGEVSGKGLGANAFNFGLPSLLLMSQDGKFLYAISSKDYAVACLARKADGAIAYQGTTDLEPIFKRDPVRDPYRWATLALSPDGKWLYAAVRNGSPRTNFYAIFRRDAETGGLTHQETVTGDQNTIANLRGWALTFWPGGGGGFLGCATGPLLTFKYDSTTGQLTDPGQVKGTTTHGFEHFLWDPAGRFLYAGSFCAERLYGFGVFVFKPPAP